MKSTNVLITGINGFIGDNLRKYIKAKYPFWHVYGIDKKGNRMRCFFRLDIKNKRKLKSILYKIKPRIIFHLAGAIASKDFNELLFLNVYSTFVLLDTIKEIENYSPRIVIPSSASEYGRVCLSEMPIEESHELNPISIYGFSKMIQTRLSLFFAEKGLDIVVARIFNIMGKGTPIYSSIGKFAYELALIKKKEKKPEINTKNLDSKRDFLDIKDVCKYLIVIALYGKKGEVYNICRGKSYRVRDLLKKLIFISEIKDIKIIEDKEYNKEFDIINSYGSIDKLKKIVKISDLVPIQKSLKDTYLYYYK